jgi:hypothetical protein
MLPSVPGYQVGDWIGADRWGSAYRAVRSKGGAVVELHLVDAALLPAPDALDRIVEQARALASLQDPNLVPILAVGRMDVGAYYVLAAVEGEILSKWLERQPKLPERACLKIGRDLLSGLAALEKAGLRHGRIRPEEVLIARDGTAMLRHGGLTELFRENAPDLFENVTDASYASPEESQGSAAGVRSDLYALGVLLRRCLSGTVDGRLDSASPSMASWIQRLCAVRPEQRFGSASEALGALAAPIPRVPTQVARRAEPNADRPAKKSPVLLAVAVAGVAAIAAGVAILGLGGGGDRPPKVGDSAQLPPHPTGGRTDSTAPARQALSLLRTNRIEPLLRDGEYGRAMRELGDFERTHPQVPSQVAEVRAEIFGSAQREYEELRTAALSRREVGRGAEAAATLRRNRPRFAGVSDLDARLEAFANELDDRAAAPATNILAVAMGQLAAAKELYRRGDETGSADLLQEAGFKAEEARVKFQALQDVVVGAQADEVRSKLRETLQLVKLINDSRKKFAGKPGDPEPDPGAKPAPPIVKPVPAPGPNDAEPVVKPEPVPEPTPAVKPGESEAAALWSAASQSAKEGKHSRVVESLRSLLKDFGTTDLAVEKRSEIQALLKTAEDELEKEAARELSKGVKDGRFHLGKTEYPEAQALFSQLKEKYSSFEAYKKHEKEIEKALERCAEELAWAAKALVSECEDASGWGGGWGNEARATATDKAAKGKGAVRIRIQPAQPRPTEAGVYPGIGIDAPKDVPADAVAVSLWLKAEGRAANVDVEIWLGEGSMQRTFAGTLGVTTTWKEYKIPFAGLRPRFYTPEVAYSGGPKFDNRDIRRVVLSNSNPTTPIECTVDEIRFVKR